MLVCSVSQLRRRAAIAADVAEAAIALDAPGTGNVVFATLVDDPASVGDHVDAFLGQIMREAASAGATVSAGSAYAGAVIEAASALDNASATTTSTFTVWDGATTTNVALSNGNLTATHTNTTTNSGARSVAQKNSGKYYFEILCTTNAGGDVLGVIAAAGTYTNAVTNGTNGAYLYMTGTIWTGGSSSGLSLGSVAAGNVIGVAVDLNNDKVWFRKAPAGNWNGLAIGSQDPANNIGGLNISALSGTTVAPVVGYGVTINSILTANFGASAFTGAVPSGFTAGWPS